MRLFVQIPCWNEQADIAEVIRAIPRSIPGVDEVAVLVIDDGSTDGTVAAARAAGADHVVSLPHRGLASAFAAGMRACLDLDADIIVNTDADRQYEGRDIPRLIAPLLDGRADVVIGDRGPGQIEHFSRTKRLLQRVGSRTVSALAGVGVPDATSGFRAYRREAALRLHVFSKFTYTVETIIQAGHSGTTVAYVPIQTNPPARASRLYSHVGAYVQHSIATMVRIYALYEPLRTFFYIGSIGVLAGVLGVLRFAYFSLQGVDGHIQSLLVSGVLVVIGFQLWMLGIIGDVMSANRRLSDDVLAGLRRRRSAPRPGDGPEAPTGAAPSRPRARTSLATPRASAPAPGPAPRGPESSGARPNAAV